MYNLFNLLWMAVPNMKKKLSQLFSKRLVIKSRNISSFDKANKTSSFISDSLKKDPRAKIVIRMGGQEDSTLNRILATMSVKKAHEKINRPVKAENIVVNYRNHDNVEALYRNMLLSPSIKSKDIERGIRHDDQET